MKSKLTIDFQGLDSEGGGNQFEPVIRAIVEDSDDVRDGLMKSFFQSLGGNSNWLRVSIQENTLYQGSSKSFIVISAVKPSELSETMESIKERLPLVKANKEENNEFSSRFSIGAKVYFTTQELINQVPKGEEIPKYYKGKIVAVTFTESKVFYDISVEGKAQGELFERIVSDYVMSFSEDTIKDLKEKDFIIK